MRIACLSLYGKNVFGYGPFEILRSWALETVSLFDDVFIEFVIPKNGSRGFQYDMSRMQEYLLHDRIRLHEVEMVNGGINQWAALSMDLYDLLNIDRTSIFYDVVLSHFISSHPVLKKTLRRKHDRNTIDVPIIGWSGAVHHSLVSYSENEIFSTTVGYCRDYMCFMTELERAIALTDCKKYLSPSMVKYTQDSSAVFSIGGLEVEKIDKVRESVVAKKNRKLCLGFGGRFDTNKGFKEVCDVYSKVAVLRDVDIVCTTADSEKIGFSSFKEKHPAIKFVHEVSKSAFYETIQSWDYGVCLSIAESVGMSWQQMIYSGVTLICIRSKFSVEELTPPGYPFIADNLKGVTQKLLYAIDNPKVAKEWNEKTKEWLRKRFDNTKACTGFHDWATSTVSTHYLAQKKDWFKGSLSEVVLGFAKTFGDVPFTFTDFVKELSKLTKSDYSVGNFIGSHYLRWVLLGLGYKDLCVGPAPMFQYTGKQFDL